MIFLLPRINFNIFNKYNHINNDDLDINSKAWLTCFPLLFPLYYFFLKLTLFGFISWLGGVLWILFYVSFFWRLQMDSVHAESLYFILFIYFYFLGGPCILKTCFFFSMKCKILGHWFFSLKIHGNCSITYTCIFNYTCIINLLITFNMYIQTYIFNV